MSAPEHVVKHEETRHLTLTPELASRCSCGAHWSHPAARSTDVMDSIFQSHVRYFENRTVVL